MRTYDAIVVGEHRLDDLELPHVARLGGDAGIIAVTRSGEIAMQYNSEGMKRASASSGRAAR